MPVNRYQLAYQKNLRFIREAKESGSGEKLDLQKQKKDSALTKPIVGLGTEDQPDPERAEDENVALDENWLGAEEKNPRIEELEEFLEKVQSFLDRDKPGQGMELKPLRMLLNKSDWRGAATMIKDMFPRKFSDWTELEIVRGIVGWKERLSKEWQEKNEGHFEEDTSRQQAWKQSRDRKDERQDEIEDRHLHECGPEPLDPLGPVTVPVEDSAVTQPEEQEDKWEGAPGARDDVKVVPVLILQMSEAHGYKDLMEAATKSGHKFYKKTPEPQKPVSLKDLFKDDK